MKVTVTYKDFLDWISSGLWTYSYSSLLSYTDRFTKNNTFEDCIDWLCEEENHSLMIAFIKEFNIPLNSYTKEALKEYLFKDSDPFDQFIEGVPEKANFDNTTLCKYIELVNTLLEVKELINIAESSNSNYILTSQLQDQILLMYNKLIQYKELLEKTLKMEIEDE